jgi:DNA helicase-2/ATP-dependent DNA helicase PcrA
VHAAARRRFGQIKQALRSRFLDGLPREPLALEGLGVRTPFVRPQGGEAAAAYDGGWRSGAGGAGAGRSARPAWDEVKDPEPDWENESQDRDESPFKPGRRVFHPSFGEGRVVDLEGQGERAKVTVQFRDGQTRKLIAKVLTRV